MAAARTFTYRNERYGFTLRFPDYFRTYCVVDKDHSTDEGEYAVRFMFKYGGKVYDPVFSIYAFRMTKRAWKREYDDSPFVFIGESGGRVFAYITPEELPEQFVDPKTGDYDYKKYGKPIRLLKRMVNDDVPAIARSIRFRRTALTPLPPPLRAKKVRVRICH